MLDLLSMIMDMDHKKSKIILQFIQEIISFTDLNMTVQNVGNMFQQLMVSTNFYKTKRTRKNLNLNRKIIIIMKNKFRFKINKWVKLSIPPVLIPYYQWTVFEKQNKIGKKNFRLYHIYFFFLEKYL